jgi:pimeloyl-ACP methyl ester carboxylesterase
MASGEYQESFITVGGAKIHFLRGGRGAPLVWIHSAEGNLGWLRCHSALAEHFTVYIPTLPGFGLSERPDWLESFFDLTRFGLWVLQEMGLGRAVLAGHFMGGWLAAEIAATAPQAVERLVLIGAAGIKPRRGEIADVFLHGVEGARRLAFFNSAQAPEYERLFGRKPSPEERELQANNREAAIRYCWKPYMHDPSLSALLGRVRAPALLVWGREDRIVPLECGELYRDAIKGARLAIIEACGNYPHLERPVEFAKAVNEFLHGGV